MAALKDSKGMTCKEAVHCVLRPDANSAQCSTKFPSSRARCSGPSFQVVICNVARCHVATVIGGDVKSPHFKGMQPQ